MVSKRPRKVDPVQRANDQKRWRENNPANYWYNRTKNNAKARGIPFELTLDDFREFMTVTHCPILGIPLNMESVSKKETSASYRPSLDRLDSSKGYTKDNVWVISCRANYLKKDATIEELEALAKAVRQKIEKTK